MATGESNERESCVAEAVAKKGRSYVPREKSTRTTARASKFEPGEPAWLKQPDPWMPPIAVTIVAKYLRADSTWEYTAEYRGEVGDIVKDLNGGDRFPENNFQRKPP